MRPASERRIEARLSFNGWKCNANARGGTVNNVHDEIGITLQIRFWNASNLFFDLTLSCSMIAIQYHRLDLHTGLSK